MPVSALNRYTDRFIAFVFSMSRTTVPHSLLSPLLPAWFETEQGRALLETQKDALPRLIPDQFYRIALQYGLSHDTLLQGLNVDQAIICDRGISRGVETKDRVIALPEALPLAESSVDLALMLHTLDYCDDPHRVLREVAQVLSPEGVLVLSGFHPFSLWGLQRKIAAQQPPLDARFIPRAVVQDRLALLGFQPVSGVVLNYQLPRLNSRWRQRLDWMNHAGDRWWPTLGAVYVLVMRKQVYGGTAVEGGRKQSAKWFPGLVPGGASAAQKNARQK